MTQPFAPFGLTIDHRYHITSLTPAAARRTGAHVGIRAGTSPKLPWSMTRHYVEALERCFDTGLPVAWFHPGLDGHPGGIGQAFPLPLKQGLYVTTLWLDQIPEDYLRSLLTRDTETGRIAD